MNQPIEDLEEAFHELGSDGWELVALTEPNDSTSRGPGGVAVVTHRSATFYFKKHN